MEAHQKFVAPAVLSPLPSSWTMASMRSRRRASTATRYPSSARARAVAAPIPDDAPVMTATRPAVGEVLRARSLDRKSVEEGRRGGEGGVAERGGGREYG